MPQAFRPPSDQFLQREDFQLFDSSTAPQVRPQQRSGHARLPAASINRPPYLYSTSAPSSSIGLSQQLQSTRQQASALFPSNSTSNVNQQSAQVVAMTDLGGGYTTSFSSDTMVTGLDGVMFDDASPFMGLENSFGGAELTTMPSNVTDHTVSPHELALNDSPSLFGSAPPSGAFTDLTSPEFLYGTSPEFGTDGTDGNWPSLFPEINNTVVPTAMQRNISNNSFSSDSANNSPLVRGLDSGHSARPSSSHRNSVGGISKSRRRQGPLKEIVVDPADKVAAKRARNTLAARESRARKANHMGHLEMTIEELEIKNSKLEREVEELKRQLALRGS